MPPPPQASARCPCRKPHPLSLVPLTEVFPEGTSEHAALRRDAPFVPPLSHRRGSATRPLEVRVRSTITSLTDIDFAKQTFTCTFFLDASWVRPACLHLVRSRERCVRQLRPAARRLRLARISARKCRGSHMSRRSLCCCALSAAPRGRWTRVCAARPARRA